MAAQRHTDDGIHERRATVQRRGILAASGAVVAGLLAKQASQPVAALDPNDVVLGSYNATAAITTIRNNSPALTNFHVTLEVIRSATSDAPFNFVDIGIYCRSDMTNGVGAWIVGDGTNGTGAIATGDAIGLRGTATGNSAVGVHGEASVGSSKGVYGHCTGGGYGVYGDSGNGRGVYGIAPSGFGVQGVSTSLYGVVGQSTSNTGVVGESDGTAASNGNGVYGIVHHVGSSQVTAGVFGDSDASYGIIGRTTAAGYSGCTGIASGANRAAFAGAGTGGAYGAYFTGPTVVEGDFTVVGGQKNAAVKHTDGSYRLLHCVESPEPWFEDFGEGKLVNGRAEVKLDPDFAAVVDVGRYHVFVTMYDAPLLVAVTQRTATGFAVQSEKAGASGAFSWRVVAKRKDIKAERLAKFELPKIRLPKPEEMPPPPAPPKKP